MHYIILNINTDSDDTTDMKSATISGITLWVYYHWIHSRCDITKHIDNRSSNRDITGYKTEPK